MLSGANTFDPDNPFNPNNPASTGISYYDLSGWGEPGLSQVSPVESDGTPAICPVSEFSLVQQPFFAGGGGSSATPTAEEIARLVASLEPGFGQSIPLGKFIRHPQYVERFVSIFRDERSPDSVYRGYLGDPKIYNVEEMFEEFVKLQSIPRRWIEKYSTDAFYGGLEYFDMFQDALGYAARLHNEWRSTRGVVDGTAVDGQPMREARWKAVAADDPAFQSAPEQFRRTRTENGSTVYEVDIANLDFARLPEKFKFENAEAALGVMEIIWNAKRSAGTSAINVDLEHAADVVHGQWLERNGSWAPPEQNKPYAELAEIEKEKDRVIVRGAVEFLNERARLLEISSHGECPALKIVLDTTTTLNAMLADVSKLGEKLVMQRIALADAVEELAQPSSPSIVQGQRQQAAYAQGEVNRTVSELREMVARAESAGLSGGYLEQLKVKVEQTVAGTQSGATDRPSGGGRGGDPHYSGLPPASELAASWADFFETTDIGRSIANVGRRVVSAVGEFAKEFAQNLSGISLGFVSGEFLGAVAQATHMNPLESSVTVLGGMHVTVSAAVNRGVKTFIDFIEGTVGGKSWINLARGLPTAFVGMGMYDEAVEALLGEDGGGYVGDFARFGGTRFAVGAWALPRFGGAAVTSLASMVEKRIEKGMASALLTRVSQNVLTGLSAVTKAIPVVGWALAGYGAINMLDRAIDMDSPELPAIMNDARALRIYRAHKAGDAEAEAAAWSAPADPAADIDIVPQDPRQEPAYKGAWFSTVEYNQEMKDFLMQRYDTNVAELDAARAYVNSVIAEDALKAREQLMGILQMKMLGYAAEAEVEGLASDPALFMNTVLSRTENFMSGLSREVEFNTQEEELKDYVLGELEAGKPIEEVLTGLMGGSDITSYDSIVYTVMPQPMTEEEATVFIEKVETVMLQKTLNSIANLRPMFSDEDLNPSVIQNEDLWDMISGFSDSDGLAQCSLATDEYWPSGYVVKNPDGSLHINNPYGVLGIARTLFDMFLEETNAYELLVKMAYPA